MLNCRGEDSVELEWAMSTDRGTTWTAISRGTTIVGDNPHYEIETEYNGDTQGVYNLKIIGLIFEDAAMYRCDHWVSSQNAYAFLIVLGK